MLSCYTDLKEYEFEYQWKIRKFSVHLACSEVQKARRTELTSSSFLIGGNTKWHLKLYLYGSEHENKDYIGLFTCYDSANETPIIWSLSREYFIIGATKKKIKLRSSSMTKFDSTTNNSGLHKMCMKKQLLDNANLYLPNDELTIVSRMVLMGPSTTSVANRSTSKLANNNLLDDFVDVVFILNGNQRIPAHKMMLIARSSVFATMFDDELKVKIGNEVQIDNMDPEVFKEMLRYIYTNHILDLDGKATSLMDAADKFRLDGLKEICANHLCDNITVDNVMKTFILAQRYNNQRLLEHTREFINTRIKPDDAAIFATIKTNSSIMKPI